MTGSGGDTYAAPLSPHDLLGELLRQRRKVLVRACDACSIRKVKCESQRPCSHCVANGLQCTLLRQRKKLGPKNLHKKTLKSIHTLVPSASTTLSPEKTVVAEADEAKAQQYLLTPQNLMENVGLISDEPIVFELVKPFTAQLLVVNFTELLTFLTNHFEGCMDKEIVVVERHNDNEFLSTLFVILTLNLLIAEVLIKLKKQKYREFHKYPKRLIQERNFKNFKNLTHFKCIEVLSLIEKNFIIPAVIPAQHIPVSSAPNTFGVYYNLLLGHYHMCTYYHILNLTNIMNGGDTPNVGHYGNEQQEQQKLLFLRKLISYFQLLNLKTASEHAAAAIQLHEMFEMLYTWERYMLLYSLTTYALGVRRNNDVILQLEREKFRTKKFIANAFDKNVVYALIEVTELVPGLIEKLSRITFQTAPAVVEAQTPYLPIKEAVLQLAQDNAFEVIKQIFLFKVLCGVGHWNVVQELDEQLTLVAAILKGVAEMDSFKVKMLNFQLLPHILHMIRVRLDITQAPINHDMLLTLSDCLIPHFSHFNNINKLIRANPSLNQWFTGLHALREERGGGPDPMAAMPPVPPAAPAMASLDAAPVAVVPLAAYPHPPPPPVTSLVLALEWDLPMSELSHNLLSLFNQISEDSANLETLFGLGQPETKADFNL